MRERERDQRQRLRCDRETDRQADRDCAQNMSGNFHKKVERVTVSGDAGKRETSLSLYRRCYSLNVTMLLFSYKICNEKY